ncbi:unnamed protein product [Rhizophagus irregularis]|nr:unnamed protein product [Rhizophagus irregularis]
MIIRYIKCNGQGACILVIKVRENGTIIGGYNPFGWNFDGLEYNDGEYNEFDEFNDYYNGRNYNGSRSINCEEYWRNTTESFIFSLDDGKDSKKFKISRVTNENYALYVTNYALDFGNGDLIINGTNGTCYQCYYESNILDTNDFSIDEMEIFNFYQN